MKITTLIHLVSLSLILVSTSSGFAQEPGRFQLFSGTVNYVTTGDEKVILKIDTVTGETWKLVGVPLNGLKDGSGKELQGIMEGWSRVEPDAMAAREELAKQLHEGKSQNK